MFHFDGHQSCIAPTLPRLTLLVRLLHHWFTHLPCTLPVQDLSSYNSVKLGYLLSHSQSYRQPTACLIHILHHKELFILDHIRLPHLRQLALRILLLIPRLILHPPQDLPHSHYKIGFLAPYATDAQRSSYALKILL